MLTRRGRDVQSQGRRNPPAIRGTLSSPPLRAGGGLGAPPGCVPGPRIWAALTGVLRSRVALTALWAASHRFQERQPVQLRRHLVGADNKASQTSWTPCEIPGALGAE